MDNLSTRPPNRPTCRHENTPGRCKECARESQDIKVRLKPLEDEFWDNRGRHDILHLLYRAYWLGVESTTS